MNIYLISLLMAISTTAFNTVPNAAPNGSQVIAGGGPIKRGAPLGSSRTVALGDLMKHPQRFSDSIITIEGVVNAVCTKKGCWMEIAATRGARGIRVTFKDYGFFVPTRSKGMKVRAEGKVVIETLSKDHVDHLTGEGATIERNPDGTATEITFIADGVELRRK